MSHLESRLLASYNPLYDKHLRSYFSHERIQAHLKHAGLITRRGEIIPEKEYRDKLARRERKKHARQAMAENIVHRAIDMERARQAKLQQHLDMLTKAALVSNVKESKRRRGGLRSSSNVSRFEESDECPGDGVYLQVRPKSSSPYRDVGLMNEEFDGQSRVLRVQSANESDDYQRKPPAKSSTFLHRQNNRPKSSIVQRSSSLHQPRAQTKPVEASCQITMVYYGSHVKADSEHTQSKQADEIMVMQQHCGGENLIVYKGNHQPGDEFTFNSRRHSDYPLGLSLYVKGYIDSRISTCCEYKHRHGVRLGGERGHFAVVSVQGSKPCLKCRFEQQKREKSLNDADGDEEKLVTMSMPVTNASTKRKPPVRIPVKHTTEADGSYSDDFDDTQQPAKTRSKAWQIIFHSSNVPTGSFQLPKKPSTRACLKVSLLAADGKTESEPYEIDLREHSTRFKSGQKDTFEATLRDIGRPKRIRVLLQIAGDDKDRSKWHLDRVELVDPDTHSRYTFSCNDWIRSSQEKLLDLTDTPDVPKRKASSSSSSSSSSSDDDDFAQKPETRYRITIHPAKEIDGEFDAIRDSRLFLRLNNHTEDVLVHAKGTTTCPSFESGKSQSFEVDLADEPPTKLTVGYYNSNIMAKKWKLQKIVLTNLKTAEETVFHCREALVRGEHDFRAQRTFSAHPPARSDSDEDLRASAARPKTRRGRQLTSEADSNDTSAKAQSKSDIWRPASQLSGGEPSSPHDPPLFSTLSKLVGNNPHGTDSDD